jgi:acetyl-CoA synthase
VSKAAVEKGFTVKDIGVVLHAKFHQDFGAILDKVEVTLYTKKEDVDKLTKRARGEYKTRDERVDKMTDEDVEIFYSCTLCQSFAPSHVCAVSPERTGLCGAYNWMDCRASYQINPTGPNQPIEKGEVLDAKLGMFKGVNEFVAKASRGAITQYNFYSMVQEPMTTCGCCECIAAMLPSCNGVMTVSREYTGETPCGMKFTTLAGVMGGGASSPGFVGHSKYNITQRKFIVGDGGLPADGLDAQDPERRNQGAHRGTRGGNGRTGSLRQDCRRDRRHHGRGDPALPGRKGTSGPIHAADHRLMGMSICMHA